MILVRHGQSEFNRIFSETRIDPGIRDAGLTELGQAQAEAVAAHLQAICRPTRLLASPYSRAIATARPIARAFGLTIEVDPLVGEWVGFSCDIGSPRSQLVTSHPDIVFDHLEEVWWPAKEEETHVSARASRFRDLQTGRPDWRETVVVSHWGFLRALTGTAVQNGTVLRLDLEAEPPGGVEVVTLAQTC